MMKKFLISMFVFLLFFGGPLYVLLFDDIELKQHWSVADRSSAHIAQNPPGNGAIVNVYAARTYGYRGAFAVHTWIAIKPLHAKKYIIYQGIGWNLFREKPIVDIKQDIPDRKWYGNKPWLLLDLRDKDAELAIEEIKAAVNTYPYKGMYNFWPGPNSNSFTAYVLRKSPALDVALPVTAIGKDYFSGICAVAPSNTGFQCSLGGVLGFTMARKEGFELNILTFSFALNAEKPFIHLPGLG